MVGILFGYQPVSAQIPGVNSPLAQPVEAGRTGSFWDKKNERDMKRASEQDKYKIKHELPIILTGEYVEYLVEDERVIAKGAAEARHDKMDLIANNIEADMKQQVVFAQGNVIFWQQMPDGKLKKVTGDFLVYHIETGDGYMKDAVIYQDPTLIRAPLVELSARKVVAPKGAVWTSCNEENPHWSIRAKKITIFPNEILVMERAGYFLGEVPIIKIGHRVMDIKQHDEKDFTMKVGYSKLKGVYQTLNWHYFFTRNQYGDLSFENSDKYGTFFNIAHSFSVKNRVQGRFTTDYSDDAVRNETIQRSTLTGTLKLDQRNTLNYNVSRFDNKRNGAYTNKEMNTSLNMGFNSKNYNIMTRYQKRSDLLKDPLRQVRSLDYVPEISINTNRQQFYSTPLFLSTRSTIGTRSESYGGTETRRNMFDTNWRFDSNRFQMSKNSALNLNGSYRIRRDNEDEKQSVLDGGAVYTQKFGDEVNSNFRYNNTRTYGFYAFQSNSIQNQNQLNMNLTYGKKKGKYDKADLRSNLFQTSYNMDTHKFGGVSNDITWQWNKSQQHWWRLYLRGNWNYGDTLLMNMFKADARLTDLFIKYDLKDSDNLLLNASTTYDLRSHKYKTLNSRINFRIDPFWNLSTDLIYDMETRSLRNINYIFERDIHCWTMKFTAQVKQKTYYMEFGLKAFPSDAQRFNKSKETGKWRREKSVNSSRIY